MQYLDFSKYITEYGELFSSGLKKQANVLLDKAVKELNALSEDARNQILSKFTSDLVDNHSFDFLLNRGNGCIPFALQEPLHNYLFPRCEQQTIPDLRYYFIIFKNDKYRAEKAYSFLDDAFESKNADTKTYQLVFEKNIRSLQFGVHELPIGLLVSKEEFTEIVRQCESIIKNGCITDDRIQIYEELKTLVEENL